MKGYKPLFSRSLASIPAHLHATAHSHHLRPDVTLAAQIECQEDAFALADRKWEKIFGEIYPAAQAHAAHLLNSGAPENIVFASDTHEILVWLLSCLPANRPARILTTDGESYGAVRQFRRLEEAGLAAVTRLAAEPFTDFPARFVAALKNDCDMVFFSHVFFNSGYIVPDISAIVRAVKTPQTLVVIDGSHSFMAFPVDLAAIKNRAFFMAGGYKYAMSGEGACFLHCPPGYGARPVDTGWFAGETPEPSGIYRFNAVMDMLQTEKIEAREIHHRVKNLQALFLNALPKKLADALMTIGGHGNFLTFRTASAGEIHDRLMETGLYTDYRDDRLRFGFGIYHDPEDMDKMAGVVKRVLA